MPDGLRSIYDLRFTVYEGKIRYAQIESRKFKIRMTRHCHNCGEEWTLTGQPGRGETCMRCRADLRVCLNCAHYDPRAAQQCRERRAEPVFGKKHMGNFCEYFEFVHRTWAPKAGITSAKPPRARN